MWIMVVTLVVTTLVLELVDGYGFLPFFVVLFPLGALAALGFSIASVVYSKRFTSICVLVFSVVYVIVYSIFPINLFLGNISLWSNT